MDGERYQFTEDDIIIEDPAPETKVSIYLRGRGMGGLREREKEKYLSEGKGNGRLKKRRNIRKWKSEGEMYHFTFT